jgi:quinone-modifying oxidoreductase subunit QmoB
MTKGAVMGVAKNGDGMIVDAENTLLGEKLQVKADLVVLGAGMVPVTKDDPVVNLAYRQGPGFRDIGLFNGYADSNFICFPYETQRTGIYAAGAIRRSMTMEEAIEDASGAALKAIQCLESVNRGVRASALRRHDLPGFLLPALHPVQALHGRVSLRRPGRR